MPTKLTLAKAIRFHRKRINLGQVEAAQRAGIRQGTWSALEMGTANPRLSTLEAVAFTLGVPVNALFTAYWPQQDEPLLDDNQNEES